ncbi:hypothetical protein PTKIN_Ptkin07bG0238300 [Pterospermum kingtungense]
MSVCEKSPCDITSPTSAAQPQPQPQPQPQRISSKKRTRQNDTPFRGVRKRRWGRYVSEIRLPGQKTRIWLGSFRSPEMAARAYDSAAYFLKGDSAILNFPHLMGSLPRPESCSRRDIQSAAAKAALQEPPVGNIGDRLEPSDGTVSDEDSKHLGWWDELGIVAFEEEKEYPLLSPLRFDSISMDTVTELCTFMDHDDFLISSFEF